MKNFAHRLQRCTTAACLVALTVLPLSSSQAGPPPGPARVLFTFAPGADGTYPGGSFPVDGLIADSQGRLYGVTQYGGLGYGVVFRLTRPATGSNAPWTEEILHSFTGTTADGGFPSGLLLLGAAGEIYGTTTFAGAGSAGNVYRLDNVPGWPITILHNFRANYHGSSPDGQLPRGGLQFGPSGLLYGVTAGGGNGGNYGGSGTIFSVSPQGDITEYAVLHRFAAVSATDGYFPIYGLLPAGPNRFYGLTAFGGAYAAGTAYSFTLNAANQWAEKVIYAFPPYGTGLNFPTNFGPLASGTGGVLYGCASSGTYGLGGVFSLTPPASPGGTWTEADVYDFGPSLNDVGECTAVTRQPTGQLLAVSLEGGPLNFGAIGQLTPPTSGAGGWTESLQYDFRNQSTVGGYPAGSLLRMGGYYYGETGLSTPAVQQGGTVFSFRP